MATNDNAPTTTTETTPPIPTRTTATTSSSTPSHSSWYDETDSGYSHELARRSVARAALHLGIESMGGDALDAMGDVLISFLERIGQCMSHAVESSNRPSSHVNVLDAIHAAETSMAAAVSHSGFNVEKPNPVSSSSSSFGGTSRGWEGLAEFGFGGHWNSDPADCGNNGGGGTDEGTGDNLPHEGNPAKGWNAPYLDLVPRYPVTRTLQYSNLAPSREACRGVEEKEDLADRAERSAEDEASRLPDRSFLTSSSWGRADDVTMTTTSTTTEEASKKRKEPDNDLEDDNPPQKRVKIATDDALLPSPDAATTQYRPPYVPSFLPSFPPRHTYQPPAARRPSKATPATKPQPSEFDDDGGHSVRRSLVRLSNHYWGTQWTQESEPPSLAVPKGGHSAAAAAVPAEGEKGIAPLNKASGSRVSRILEGSMDTAL